MLLPGHQGGVSWYEQRFWTPFDICDLGQQGDLYTQTILGTPRRWKCQNYDMDSRSPPTSLICAICWPCITCSMNFSNLSKLFQWLTRLFFGIFQQFYLSNSVKGTACFRFHIIFTQPDAGWVYKRIPN